MTQSLGLEPILSADAAIKLAELCHERSIVWLAVFGSVARGEARDDSDIDLLVEFEPEAKISYIDLERTAELLSPIFGGRYVDIGRPSQLHWTIRNRVRKEARVVYAR